MMPSNLQILTTQLSEKALNEYSLAEASDNWVDKNYHLARQSAFEESVKDVQKILNE